MLVFSRDKDELVLLRDETHHFTWISKRQNIAQLTLIDCKLADLYHNISIEQQDDGILFILHLCLRNQMAVDVQVVYPSLQFDNGASIHYCFPSLVPRISDVPAEFEMSYATWFPMQFIGFWTETNCCLTLLGQDEDNHDKKFCLTKAENGTIRCAIRYGLHLEKDVPVTLQAKLVGGSGDWHQCLSIYRSFWSRNHYNARWSIGWLRGAFTFRQWFMHKNYDTPFFDEKSKTYRVEEKLQDDRQAIGTPDYIQVFDWAYEPEMDRLGNYSPWKYLNGKQSLTNVFAYLHEQGVSTGLYFEGYLLGRKNPFADRIAERAHVRDKEQNCYSYVGRDFYTLCIGDERWVQWLQNRICDVVEELPVLDAIYIDEFSLGEQYKCYSTYHNHTRGYSQVQREALFLKELKTKLSRHTAVITEYFPPDESIEYLDASLTYANPLLNLSRFAFPEFKQFVIIKCDAAINNDVSAAKRIFFNGQGIWLSGNVHDEIWFGRDFLAFVKKMHKIFIETPEFQSTDCIPLRYGEEGDVCVNEFRSKYTVIWTLYNTSEQCRTVSYQLPTGMMRVKDIWNGKNVEVRCQTISITLGKGEIGCLKFTTNRESE